MWESKDIQLALYLLAHVVVVVWCGNQKIYNARLSVSESEELWFDVGIKRYTTFLHHRHHLLSCGLMWESKDIQHNDDANYSMKVVVWCGNQKIYNPSFPDIPSAKVVVWCGNQKIYNGESGILAPDLVVVWCGNQKIYNSKTLHPYVTSLWFDVGIKRYTTELG